jgi:hypothetical protein
MVDRKVSLSVEIAPDDGQFHPNPAASGAFDLVPAGVVLAESAEVPEVGVSAEVVGYLGQLAVANGTPSMNV